VAVGEFFPIALDTLLDLAACSCRVLSAFFAREVGADGQLSDRRSDGVDNFSHGHRMPGATVA
jgi:hypothetical protein